MTRIERPTTHYAKNGDVHIAYQVLGDGPHDLLFSSGIFSNIEVAWELPAWANFYRRLGSFARVVLFDLRGIGLSDRGDPPYLEMQMDDIVAVLDAAGVERACVFGVTRSASIATLFAATHPHRVKSLVLYGLTVKGLWSPDFPIATQPEERLAFEAKFIEDFGSGRQLELQAPTAFADRDIVDWWGHFERLMSSPGRIREYLSVIRDIDLRPALHAINAPTLLLHRKEDRVISVEQSRYAASQIRDVRLVELPGCDHLPIFGDPESVLDEIEEFVTGVRPAQPVERILTTVLFLDLVSSTERASGLGDAAWVALLKEFLEVVRAEIASYRGREVKTTGDGVLACFDGPARATRCARSVVDRVKSLGLSVRAGLHTGECELLQDDLGGIAVHLAARVMDRAAPDEVLVTTTVKDLSLGSGIEFLERGSHELKGVPGTWNLFAAV